MLGSSEAAHGLITFLLFVVGQPFPTFLSNLHVRPALVSSDEEKLGEVRRAVGVVVPDSCCPPPVLPTLF